jgi:hypothetical protein
MMNNKKKWISYVLMFTLLSGFLPAQLFAAVESVPHFMDPQQILGQLPGQQRNITPQVPNPLQQVTPTLPQGMQGGMPNPPMVDSAQMNGQRLPDSQENMQHPVDITTGHGYRIHL